MVPVNIASVLASLGVLLLFSDAIFLPHDVAQLKSPSAAIKDLATFQAGWVVLVLLLVGFFALEPLGVPVSAVAAVGLRSCWLWPRVVMSSAPGKYFMVLRGRSWCSRWGCIWWSMGCATLALRITSPCC